LALKELSVAIIFPQSHSHSSSTLGPAETTLHRFPH
jgi:hypothetical protein